MSALTDANRRFKMDFPEFVTTDGLLRLPRTPDNKMWKPYTISGDQVGALHALLGLIRRQAREIDELRPEAERASKRQTCVGDMVAGDFVETCLDLLGDFVGQNDGTSNPAIVSNGQYRRYCLNQHQVQAVEMLVRVAQEIQNTFERLDSELRDLREERKESQGIIDEIIARLDPEKG